jgi:hypothetical protein
MVYTQQKQEELQIGDADFQTEEFQKLLELLKSELNRCVEGDIVLEGSQLS